MPDLDDFESDPEPPDENDPQYREELFRFFRSRGWAPEDLIDKKYARLYRKC